MFESILITLESIIIYVLYEAARQYKKSSHKSKTKTLIAICMAKSLIRSASKKSLWGTRYRLLRATINVEEI